MKNISRKRSKKYIRCQACQKDAVIIQATAGFDGRPKYKCKACNFSYTNGNPYDQNTKG